MSKEAITGTIDPTILAAMNATAEKIKERKGLLTPPVEKECCGGGCHDEIKSPVIKELEESVTTFVEELFREAELGTPVRGLKRFLKISFGFDIDYKESVTRSVYNSIWNVFSEAGYTEVVGLDDATIELNGPFDVGALASIIEKYSKYFIHASIEVVREETVVTVENSFHL